MSYELFVFDSAVSPVKYDEFLSWFGEQTEWEKSHSYDDPEVLSAALRAWFLDIIVDFPAINGTYANNDRPDDEAAVTGYTLGSTLIYAVFAWSKRQEAYEATFRLAAKHQLGFFDISSETSKVWLPDSNGNLILAHSN
jgi:hypothetical protein